ncbi:hypothetical protein [Pseudonocardia alni]|uniref:hypothetical protein n=1 Tax=Pseudonocardia alni TaxID=33907 RepID=UPI0034092E73
MTGRPGRRLASLPGGGQGPASVRDGHLVDEHLVDVAAAGAEPAAVAARRAGLHALAAALPCDLLDATLSELAQAHRAVGAAGEHVRAFLRWAWDTGLTRTDRGAGLVAAGNAGGPRSATRA